MARPTLFTHPKFVRLVHLLGIPKAHVLGHLELMWTVGYSSGEPVIGDVLDVELAAGWVGEHGAWVRALSDPLVRLLDTCTDGRYAIHDLHDHAPHYVRERWRKEQERKKKNVKTSNPKRARSAHGVRTRPTSVPDTRALSAQVAPTPSPSPAPTPAPTHTPAPTLRGPSPIHTTHRSHAACGRVCVPAFLHTEFVSRRNTPNGDDELRSWYGAVNLEWIDGRHKDEEPGDAVAFWRARYAEKWPATMPSAKKPFGTWRPVEAR